MRASTKSRHLPATNVPPSKRARRFCSTAPYFGADGQRFPVNQAGFEAVPGYQPLQMRRQMEFRGRNISELTYGPWRNESLQVGAPLSSGQQTMITNTSQYPWRAMTALKITVPGKEETYFGSGWFIGPYTVITAAHVVYPHETDGYSGWAADIEVVPGLNGGENTAPFGTYHSQSFYCPTGWQNGADLRLDYAAILLDQGVGTHVGTMGYATYSDQDLVNSIVNIAGYPVEPEGSPAAGTLWYAAGTVSNVDEFFVYYSLATEPGESGSAVYRNMGDRSFVTAVHTAGTDSVDRGLRITEPVYENLQQWATMMPGS
jgi:glutamyl endopeptidase